jgi:excisionase family DNA binding protein
MSQLSTGLGRREKQPRSSPSVAPLAVPPQEAARLLSLGMWRIYQLMRAGELDSYQEGRARRITMASIHARMARQLAAARNDGWRQIAPNPAQHRKVREESEAQ